MRFCYTDFHLATRINFLSGEKVICSAKLGPITTEYFLDYRSRVEAATEAARSSPSTARPRAASSGASTLSASPTSGATG